MDAQYAPDAWNVHARVPKAARHIEGLTNSETVDLIWERVKGVANRALPGFERFERPADIFIDVSLSSDWEHRTAREKIESGVGDLIRRLAEKNELANAVYGHLNAS